MTIRLLAAYGIYPQNAIITIDSPTEAGLIASGQASATLTGGVAYSQAVVNVSNQLPAAAPTNVLALAGNGMATVQWLGNHSGAPASWTVTANPGGASVTVPATAVQGSATVSGLTNGTAYTFTVTANNTLGSSLPSTASNSVTPTALPSTILPVTRGLEFWWSAGQVASPPANGVQLANMVDISGNGYNAAGLNGGGPWVTNWSSSKPAVSLNAATFFQAYDTLASGLIAGMRGTGATIYVVYDCTANPSANTAVTSGRVISHEGPNPTPIGINIETVGGGFALAVGATSGQGGGEGLDSSLRYSNGQTLTAPNIATPTTPIRATITRGMDSAGVVGGLRVNGAAVAGVIGPVVNTGACWSFGGMYQGAYNKYMTGRIAEIVIFATTHTAAEIAAMETYLATRY